MDSIAAAISTAAAVSTIGSHFMLDGNTYKRGAELGFQGLDFYVTGRGGVLGDVDADVVSAAFTFFEVDGLRPAWESAEEHTNRAIAHAYDGLADAERAELADLANALHGATAG